MSTLHAIGNWLYWILGLSGTGPFYAYHSASGANWGMYLQFVVAAVALRFLFCHEGGAGFRGCHSIFSHKVEGQPFRMCHQNHPVLSQHPKKITAALVKELHEAAQAAKREESAKLDEIHRHVTALSPAAGTFEPPPVPAKRTRAKPVPKPET